MIGNNKIPRIIIFAIISVFVCSYAFAVDTEGTLFHSQGSPVSGKIVQMEVGFPYDPENLQYLQFGFTNSNNIDPQSISNSKLNLRTQVMQGRGELARGKGNINFYWVLRTNKSVTAKLYLKDLLTEIKSSAKLDWSIKFDSQINNVISHNNKIDSSYGIENAIPIFAKTDTSMSELLTGYLPIEVVTDYAPVKIENQSYVGTVGVVVETN